MNTKITHTLLIFLVRIIPMLASLYVFTNAIEVLYSIHVENYVEYYDGDKLLYIVYNSPISDVIAEYVSVSWLTIVLMFVTSYAFKFCAYHRTFIWYLVIGKLSAIYGNYNILDDAFVFYIVLLALFGITIGAALYLHQKYGDRAI